MALVKYKREHYCLSRALVEKGVKARATQSMALAAAPSLERVCYEFLGTITFNATSFM